MTVMICKKYAKGNMTYTYPKEIFIIQKQHSVGRCNCSFLIEILKILSFLRFPCNVLFCLCQKEQKDKSTKFETTNKKFIKKTDVSNNIRKILTVVILMERAIVVIK